MLTHLAVGLENLAHQGQMALRGASQLGGQRWYWRLGYALWLESLRGAARHARRGFEPPPGLQPEDFTYGETPLWTAHQLLSWAQLPRGGRFVEVGCGRAVTSLVARLVFDAEVTAFEVVPALADKARWLNFALQAGVEIFTKGEGPYPTAALYYLTPTTWSDANIAKVAQGLSSAPAGSRAVVLTQPLPGWQVLEERPMPFSWGWSRTYLMAKGLGPTP